MEVLTVNKRESELWQKMPLALLVSIPLALLTSHEVLSCVDGAVCHLICRRNGMKCQLVPVRIPRLLLEQNAMIPNPLSIQHSPQRSVWGQLIATLLSGTTLSDGHGGPTCKKTCAKSARVTSWSFSFRPWGLYWSNLRKTHHESSTNIFLGIWSHVKLHIPNADSLSNPRSCFVYLEFFNTRYPYLWIYPFLCGYVGRELANSFLKFWWTVFRSRLRHDWTCSPK